jgi:hypothetical protein
MGERKLEHTGEKARDGWVATPETGTGSTTKTQNDQESTTSRPLCKRAGL